MPEKWNPQCDSCVRIRGELVNTAHNFANLLSQVIELGVPCLNDNTVLHVEVALSKG
jgi:hypothetical protein